MLGKLKFVATRSALLALVLSIGLLPTLLSAQATGSLTGQVLSAEGDGIEGVMVLVQPGDRSAVTDPWGSFAFTRVPEGTHSITFSLNEYQAPTADVEVIAGQATVVERTFEWDFSYMSTMTVESASRRRERLVDAPAAMTLVTERAIDLEGGAGQLPTLLEFTVGAEPTQSGLFDFNFNTRGFNGFLTRRIQVIVDGRDPAIPATSAQEWWTIAMLGEDLESIELLRGPSAALYGPNSVNGVLNLVTKAPQDSLGGSARVTVGELGMFGADARWAGSLGNDWFMKVMGSHAESETFTQSRNVTVDYEGIPLEVVPLATDEVDFDSGSVRFDRDFENGDVLTLEAGGADGSGETYLTGVGRFQELDVKRRWARIYFGSNSWNASAYLNDRVGDQLSLPANAPLLNDEFNYKVELQANHEFNGGKARLVGGASLGREEIDSADDNGVETLYFEPIDVDEESVFGQLDIEVNEKLKLVTALRWDNSTLHDSELSPKASVVYAPNFNHSFRLSYNQAFQVGTYTEIFLSVPAGPPIDLSVVEASLAPLLGDVSLGLEFIPVLALGNTNLEVEKIKSFELGYRGVLGDKTLLTVDYYNNEMEDFFSDILPGLNPAFPAYRAPAALDPAAAATVEGVLLSILPGLTNDPSTGAPQFVVSFTNTGKVDSQGVEVALTHQPNRSWLFDFSYSWFDFEVKEETPGAPVSPNTPENQASFGVTLERDRLTSSFHLRWVEGFDWATGIYVGRIPSYEVAKFNLNFELSPRLSLGLNVSNLFDNVHYEAFGGDLIERRALVHLSTTW